MSGKWNRPLGLIDKFMSKIGKMLELPTYMRDLNDQVNELKDLVMFQQTKALQSSHSNPLNKCGKKCFSQTDEDGITLEILRRINKISAGVYAEFGVGDGTENNTLVLAALGWKGFWVGSEDLSFLVNDRRCKTFAYFREWITIENIIDLMKRGLKEIGAEELDVLSLDLDGNDIYFIETLLVNNLRPKLFILEYNAKFPPPVEFQIAYDSQHIWNGDDYFGASLSTLNKLLNKFEYRLVCCNSHSGTNAFFIDAAYSRYFLDVPTDINQLYVEPRYHLYNQYGHRNSVKTVKSILSGR